MHGALAMATVNRVYRFEIDGQSVFAYESAGHRLWRCDCGQFQRALGRGEEGRCPHVAVASWRAVMEGTIQFQKPHPVSEEPVD